MVAVGPGRLRHGGGRRELWAQMTKGPVRLSQHGGVGAVRVELPGVAEAEERRGAGAVSVELRGAAEVEERHGAWAAEAKEPRGAGAVSVEFHRVGATEVEERHWAADMALNAARPRDPNPAQFKRALGL